MDDPGNVACRLSLAGTPARASREPRLATLRPASLLMFEGSPRAPKRRLPSLASVRSLTPRSRGPDGPPPPTGSWGPDTPARLRTAASVREADARRTCSAGRSRWIECSVLEIWSSSPGLARDLTRPSGATRRFGIHVAEKYGVRRTRRASGSPIDVHEAPHARQKTEPHNDEAPHARQRTEPHNDEAPHARQRTEPHNDEARASIRQSRNILP
jgi:hypothetical protein